MDTTNFGLIISTAIKSNMLIIFSLIFLGIIIYYVIKNKDNIDEKLTRL